MREKKEEEDGRGGRRKQKKLSLLLLLPSSFTPPSLSFQPLPPPHTPSLSLSLPETNTSLVTRLLLLLAEQRPQRDAGHFHDLESDTGDVADGVAAAAEAGDEDLVLFFGF